MHGSSEPTGNRGTSSGSGRISFASVTTEETGYWPLLRPLIRASNAALTAWLYPCWRTAHVRWSPPLNILADRVRGSGRPVIYYSWHAYELMLLLGFRDVPGFLKPIGIGHDGVLSRMLQSTGARLGFHLWIYRRKSAIRPRDQIIELIRTRECHIGLFTDAGGPYGRVKPGLAEIARATDALVVPLITRGRPRLKLSRPWRYGIPLPYCRVVVFNGPPLDGRHATLVEYQSAMDELEEMEELR